MREPASQPRLAPEANPDQRSPVARPLDHPHAVGIDNATPTGPSPPRHPLSQRELDVIRLMTDGQSNRAIADTLSISVRTVQNHVCNILTKLGLESRTAAAAWAVRNGIA